MRQNKTLSYWPSDDNFHKKEDGKWVIVDLDSKDPKDLTSSELDVKLKRDEYKYRKAELDYYRELERKERQRASNYKVDSDTYNRAKADNEENFSRSDFNMRFLPHVGGDVFSAPYGEKDFSFSDILRKTLAINSSVNIYLDPYMSNKTTYNPSYSPYVVKLIEDNGKIRVHSENKKLSVTRRVGGKFVDLSDSEKFRIKSLVDNILNKTYTPVGGKISVIRFKLPDQVKEELKSDDMEKSRKGDPIGTVKIWSGKEWEKTPTGWKPRSKGREKKESGGWGSPKLLGLNVIAVNEFQNKVAAHVKYNGKSYAVTVLTPKEANEQGYTITPSNLQYLTSGVKKSESRDRAILSLLRKTTYSDFKAQGGEESLETNSPLNNQQEKYLNEFKEMSPGDAFEHYQVLANEGNKDGIEAFQKYLQEKGEPPVVDETSIEDYKGISYKKISDEDYKKELSKIKEKSTEEQIEAIDYYVDGGNYAIRKQLDGRLNNEKVERYINTLTDYIDNPENRISKNTPLYRCIPYNSVSKEILSLNVGDGFEDKSFSSFSTQRVTDFGQGVQITLLAKKGQKIANLLNDYQNEYLVQKGSKFKIISKGYRSVVVELVDEDYNDRAMITDKFGKALENDIEKAKAVPVGTVREKNGVKWIKTPNGWKYQRRGRKKKVEDPQNPQSSKAPEPAPEVKKQAIEGYAKDASNEQLQNAINSDKQTPEVKEIAQKELEKRGITPSNGDNKEGGENSEMNVSPKEKEDSLSALETLLNSSDISDSFKKKIQAEYDRMKGVKAGEDNEKLKQENDALKKENESLKKQSTLQGVDDKQYKRISNLVENSNFVSRNVKLTIDGKDASPYMTKYKGKVKFYMKDENGKKTDSFDTLDEYISAWKGNQGSSTPSTTSEAKETKVEQQPQSQEKPQSVMDEMEKEDKAAYSKELEEKKKREAAEKKRRSEENRRKLNEEASQREQQKPTEEQKPQKQEEKPQELSFEEQAQKETEKRLKALFKKYPVDKDQKEALNYYEEKFKDENGNLKKVIRYYQNKSNIGNIAYRVAFQRFLAKHKKPPIVDDLLFSDYNGESYSREGAYAYERAQAKLKKSTPQDVSKSLKSYADIGYNAVREYCSGEGYQDSEEVAKMVDNISNFIDKNKLEKNRTLFRCLLNYGGSINSLLKLKPGDVFRDESFSSFSNNMLGSFGTDLQITLLAKKGESAANIMNVYEQEYLLQRNRELRVIAKGFNSIVVEAVD